MRGQHAIGMLIVVALSSMVACNSADDAEPDEVATTSVVERTTTTEVATSTTTAPAGEPVDICSDPVGDSQAMRGLDATPAALANADLTSVSLSVADDALSVTFEMDGPAVLTEGSRSLKLTIAPLDSRYPAAEVRVGQSVGSEDDVSITVWRAQSDFGDVDASTMVSLLDGRTVTVVVPVGMLAPALDGSWQWFAGATAAGIDAMAQDECGSADDETDPVEPPRDAV